MLTGMTANIKRNIYLQSTITYSYMGQKYEGEEKMKKVAGAN